MKKNALAIVSLSFAAALTACGRLSKESNESSLAAMHRKVIPLTSGEYLVTVKKHTACASTPLAVIQHWEYPDPTEAMNPVIELDSVLQGMSVHSPSTDNNENCEAGQSRGWTVINLPGDAVITTDWGNDITSIESIRTKLTASSKSEILLDSKKSYVLDAKFTATCLNQPITIIGQQNLIGTVEQGETLDKKMFTALKPVTDNLFHRAICRTPAISSASEYIQTSNNRLFVNAAPGLPTLLTLDARQIIERTQVYPLMNFALDLNSEIEITGEDGSRLMNVLGSLGIVDTDPMIGATNLSLTELRCDQNSRNPRRGAICSYKTVNNTTRQEVIHTGISGYPASEFFSILENYGATVPAGINPSYRAVAAKRLTCSKPVIPNPVVTCWIETL
jgi:hypothetical protein